MASIEEAAMAHRWQDCSLALVRALSAVPRSNAIAFCRAMVVDASRRLRQPAAVRGLPTFGLTISDDPVPGAASRSTAPTTDRDMLHAFELLEQSDAFDSDSPDQLIAAVAAVGRAVFACRMAAWRRDGVEKDAFLSSSAATSVGEALWLHVAAMLGETPTTSIGDPPGKQDLEVRDRARWAVEAGIL